MTEKNIDQSGPNIEVHQLNEAGGDVSHRVVVQQQIGTIASGGTAIGVVYQGLTTNEVAALFLQFKREDQPQVWNGINPYRGLRAYQQRDAPYFFGRESLVTDLLERVKTSPFIVIAGPSGSGKSSVARAGLLHALHHGTLDGSQEWLLAPMSPQGDPIAQLALAMQRVTRAEAIGEIILTEGRKNPQLLAEAIEMYLSDDRWQRCLLLVDQFEETFTQTRDPAVQTAFINLLTGAVQTKGSRMIIVLSMRSDFVSHCVRFPALRELMSRQFQLVGAMEPHDLAKAISLPAMEVGAEIEAALVSRIMDDMKGEPGALPLMSFALRDIFEAEKTKAGHAMDLTLQEYLDRGGIEEALERHANHVFATFSEEQQELAKNIFSRLIDVGQGRVDTRRTATMRELVPAGQDGAQVSAVISALSQEDVRLITTKGVESGAEITEAEPDEATVTIAHEKLIDAWPWLRRLVDENREIITLQNQIHSQAELWAVDEDAGYLYRSGQLAQVEEKLAVLQPGLDELSQRFIQASIAQRKISARNRRLVMAGLGMLTILALVAAVFAFRFAGQASDNAAEAESNLVIAKVEKQRAELQTTRAVEAEKDAVDAQGTADAARIEAERQYRVVLGQSLAALASMVNDPTIANIDLNLLLALEALHLHEEYKGNAKFLADESLRDLLSRPYPRHNLSGHEAPVVSVAFSPDGQRLASGSADETVWVWDLANPADEPLLLSGHNGPVVSVAFSPDGRQIASGSDDETVRVWDLDNLAAEPLILSGHTGWVNSVAFSPDGQQIASGGVDEKVQVWDPANPAAEPLLLSGHNGPVSSIAFSPDGQKIASGSDDEKVRVWDLANPEAEPLLLNGHYGPVNSVAFSPDGQQIASGGNDDTVRVWDLANPAAQPLVLKGHIDKVWSVAFSPDGQQLVSGGVDQTVRVWDLANPAAEPLELSGHTGSVVSVAFSPNGKQIASGSGDQTVRVWDLAHLTGEPLMLSDHTDKVWSVAFAPDGQQIASGSNDQTVRVWDLAHPSAQPLLLRGHTGPVVSAAFSPDGQQIASGGVDQTVRVWDLANPSAQPILLSGQTGPVASLAFSPDGQQIASGGDQTIRVWDLANPTAEPLLFRGHNDRIWSVAFAPDGQQIASGSTDKTVRVWDLANPEAKPLLLSGHTGPVYSVAFSPNGRQVASGSGDETVRVWDLANPTAEPLLLSGHTGSVESVAFSPDGLQIASGSKDQMVRVWDLTNLAAEPLLLSGHTGLVTSVAFSPDGQQIASGSWDNTVRVWPALERLTELACQHVSRKGLTEAEWKMYVGDVMPWREEGQCDLEAGVPVWWEGAD